MSTAGSRPDRLPDLSSVRSVVTADVYKAGRLAGHLDRRPGGVRFRYTADYLADPGPAVATTVPLTDEPLSGPGGGILPFFAGLLPEGRRLTNVRRAVKTSADDDLSLLLAVGADPVGDVQVVASGDHPKAASPALVVDDPGSLDFSSVLAESGMVDPVALAGVQEKASARTIAVPVSAATGEQILKLSPPEYPHLVANEAFMLGIARRLRLPVVTYRLITDRTGRQGLLVDRFDRTPSLGGAVARLAVEDAGQLLGLYPADKYNAGFEAVAAAVVGVCAARSVAARNVLQQLTLAWLTGNGDLHAKNLSVVQAAGEWRMSPLYDLPSTLPYGDTTMALSLAGRTSGLSRRKLLAFAAKLDLPARAAERAIDEVLVATADLVPRLDAGALAFDSQVIRNLHRVLTRHRRDLTA
jgi:serine/threonine-protein kinase HipA